MRSRCGPKIPATCVSERYSKQVSVAGQGTSITHTGLASMDLRDSAMMIQGLSGVGRRPEDVHHMHGHDLDGPRGLGLQRPEAGHLPSNHKMYDELLPVTAGLAAGPEQLHLPRI